MPVLCESRSIIILRDSINQFFQDGWLRFLRDSQFHEYSCDGEIVSVIFRNEEYFQKYLDYLIDQGLRYQQSTKDPAVHRKVDDVIVLDHFNGIYEKASWAEYGDKKIDDETCFYCWMKNTNNKTLASPFMRGEGQIIRRMSCSIKPSEFERFQYLRTENELDIYLDKDSNFDKKCFMPQGMSIENYYELLKPEREKAEALNKVNAKEHKAKQKAKQQEVDKANKKRLAQEKKAEDALYRNVAKVLNTKAIDRDNPMRVMESLIERALKSNDEKDLEIIDTFWHANYGLFGSLDYSAGDNFYDSVDGHEIIRRMIFEWEHYGDDESEKNEMSQEDLFDTFKNAIENEFEDCSARYVKQVGKYAVSAYIFDPREGQFTDFWVHNNVEELADSYKNSDRFYIDGGDGGNFNEQTLRAFFDKHY